MLDEWQDKIIHEPEFVNARVYKGIPHTLRGTAWKTMVDLEDYMLQQPPGFYDSLVRQECSIEHTEQIRLDLPRTFPDHVTLCEQAGRENLFNVLKAYTIFNPHIGYCQGLSYVAAVFLMFMNPEESFWMLHVVLSRDNLEAFYNPKMSKLIENAQMFDRILSAHLPNLAAHLAQHKMDSLLYVTPWWVCTFTGLPNWEVVMRIWDCFIWEGANATFRIALAILQLIEAELLAVRGAEGLLPILLRPNISKYGADALLKIAANVPILDLLVAAVPADLLEPASPLPERSESSTTTTPAKSPKKRKVATEPTKSSSSFLGRIFKNFTPAVHKRTASKKNIYLSLHRSKPRSPKPTK